MAYGHAALDSRSAVGSDGVVCITVNLSLRLAECPFDLLIANAVLQEFDLFCLRHQLSLGLADDALRFLDLQSQSLLLQALVVEVSLLIQNLRLHLVDVSLVVVHPDINL